MCLAIFLTFVEEGALNISTPRRRGKEAPPQDIFCEGCEESEASEETSASEDGDPPYDPDEIGHSQLPDAPTPSQRSPPAKRQARARDRADIGSVNVLPTRPGCPPSSKETIHPTALP